MTMKVFFPLAYLAWCNGFSSPNALYGEDWTHDPLSRFASESDNKNCCVPEQITCGSDADDTNCSIPGVMDIQHCASRCLENVDRWGSAFPCTNFHYIKARYECWVGNGCGESVKCNNKVAKWNLKRNTPDMEDLITKQDEIIAVIGKAHTANPDMVYLERDILDAQEEFLVSSSTGEFDPPADIGSSTGNDAGEWIFNSAGQIIYDALRRPHVHSAFPVDPSMDSVDPASLPIEDMFTEPIEKLARLIEPAVKKMTRNEDTCGTHDSAKQCRGSAGCKWRRNSRKCTLNYRKKNKNNSWSKTCRQMDQAQCLESNMRCEMKFSHSGTKKEAFKKCVDRKEAGSR